MKLDFQILKCFFYLKTTSKLQPMDQGIIKCFRNYYRKRIVKKLISDLIEGKTPEIKNLSLLSCILISKRAWNDVTQQTIKNCLKNAVFIIQMIKIKVLIKIKMKILILKKNQIKIYKLYLH